MPGTPVQSFRGPSAAYFTPAELRGRTEAECRAAARGAFIESIDRNVDRSLPLDQPFGPAQQMTTDVIADYISDSDFGLVLLEAMSLAEQRRNPGELLRRLTQMVADAYACAHSGAWE